MSQSFPVKDLLLSGSAQLTAGKTTWESKCQPIQILLPEVADAKLQTVPESPWDGRSFSDARASILHNQHQQAPRRPHEQLSSPTRFLHSPSYCAWDLICWILMCMWPFGPGLSWSVAHPSQRARRTLRACPDALDCAILRAHMRHGQNSFKG